MASQAASPKAVSSHWQRVSRIGGAFLVLLIAYILIVNAIPLEPYRINFYVAEPMQDCPNDPVTLSVNDTLNNTFWRKGTSYRLETYWRAVNGPFRTDIEPFKGTFGNSYGASTHISPIERTAPGQAGDWRVVTDMTIYGTVLGFPRQDEYHFMSEQTVFTTKPANAPECVLVAP